MEELLEELLDELLPEEPSLDCPFDNSVSATFPVVLLEPPLQPDPAALIKAKSATTNARRFPRIKHPSQLLEEAGYSVHIVNFLISMRKILTTSVIRSAQKLIHFDSYSNLHGQGFGSLSFRTMLICLPMDKIPSGLAPAVFIPGLAFEALVRLRDWGYSSNRLRQRRLKSPVISIGNLTLGGTGKTPLVIHIAQMLINLGRSPAILSRGYGRLSGGMHILPPDVEIKDPASELGDEPALIRRRVPAAWLGISKNRFETGSLLEQNNKLAFLLDDGFQHRKLYRDLDIVVIDGSQPLESNSVFPRGTLREPISALRRCDIIIVHSASDNIVPLKNTLGRLGCTAEVFECEQKISAIISFPDWQKSSESTTARPCLKTVYPVTALGNPKRFLRDLSRAGIKVNGKKLFPDHHRLSRKDWRTCYEEARRNAVDAIILTEKDAIKLTDPPDFPLMVAIQSTEMLDAGALEMILKKLWTP